MAITFDVFLIKPTRYDDEGYPLQWRRSIVPSNSLACLAGILAESVKRGALPADVEVRAHTIDECNTYVDVDALIARHRRGEKLMVCLVGVQSNQYPRAMDIARPLRAAGAPVCIGGFHVSGVIAMLGADAPELALARELGVSIFAGEAEEGRFDAVLADGWADALKPLYNHLADLPDLRGAPVPILDAAVVRKSAVSWSSFDLGRGCPFECSFCTIINVQGRKSRFRTVEDLEAIIRANHANGVDRFFLTDDNFARNRNWEAYADRLIHLRQSEGIKVRLIIQVDTMAHRVPRFIDKVVAAGVHVVFIGLENINPDNLEAVKKRQNRIEDYREMVIAWKKHPVVISCGYIIGFPRDTKASILNDIEILKRELPVDLLYLNYLTPLPGSEDHKRMRAAGEWMDPDLNKYDLNHRVTHHSAMSDKEWEEAFDEAHLAFYSFAHMSKVFERMVTLRSNKRYTTLFNLVAYREGRRLDGVAFADFGVVRIMRRKQRRYGLKLESPLVFYPRYAARTVAKAAAYAATWARLRLALAKARRAEKTPRLGPYEDRALALADGPSDALIEATAARGTERLRKRLELKARRRGAEAPGLATAEPARLEDRTADPMRVGALDLGAAADDLARVASRG